MGELRVNQSKMSFLFLAFLTFVSFTSFTKSQEISTDETLTQYYLWSNPNSNQKQELIFDDFESILASNFDANLPTKVLVHGFGDSGTTSWVIGVKNEFLKQGDYNVISVDWERLAGPSPWYGIAAANTRTVGARSGRFLKFLINEFGLNIDDIHVIGFSLGGQLVAFIGQELNGTLPRITGLDPAGFLFHTNPADEKLSPDDARFVDVIHSAGLWIGTDEQVGHVDFYPNGGTAPQPGCEGNDDLGLGCSHARAPDFLEESINSQVGFRAVQCSSIEDYTAGLCNGRTENWMGLPADVTKPGIYFLATNAQRPYAQE